MTGGETLSSVGTPRGLIAACVVGSLPTPAYEWCKPSPIINPQALYRQLYAETKQWTSAMQAFRRC
jgi:hypothetical protein